MTFYAWFCRLPFLAGGSELCPGPFRTGGRAAAGYFGLPPLCPIRRPSFGGGGAISSGGGTDFSPASGTAQGGLPPANGMPNCWSRPPPLPGTGTSCSGLPRKCWMWGSRSSLPPSPFSWITGRRWCFGVPTIPWWVGRKTLTWAFWTPSRPVAGQGLFGADRRLSSGPSLGLRTLQRGELGGVCRFPGVFGGAESDCGGV